MPRSLRHGLRPRAGNQRFWATGGAEKGPKSEAAGLKYLPLLLFGLGIVLGVDLRGLSLYNIV